MRTLRNFLIESKRLTAVVVMLPFWALAAFTDYCYVSQMISMVPLHDDQHGPSALR
jgi:hypothetical protein